MTALLTDNLPLLAGAPNGIKKLRELILELAVRGKLVPQDPNDEPASELLKRIAEEKTRLVAEGKIKKQKPLTEIDEEALPFELPAGWVWTRLGEITNFGSTIKKDEIPEDAWVLDLEDIEKDTSKLLQKARFYDRNSLSDKNSFTKGDVLYGKLRPYLNKVLVAEDDGFCTTEILPFRCHGPFVAHYFVIALKSPYFLSYVNAKSYGMKMPRLGTEGGRQAFFPLPPLAEQHRIVAKVDELMALCDRLEAQQADAESAHTQLVQALLGGLTQTADAQDFAASWQHLAEHFHTLFTTEPSIDALKQTLLQLAVMGKLVPQDPSDEPASELLKRIAEEKGGLVAAGKLKKQKPLTDVDEEEKPFDLPKGWQWVRLGQVAEASTGHAFKSSEYRASGTFVLRVTNINPDGTLDLTDAKYIDQVAANSTYQSVRLEAGEILLVMVGGSLGKIGVVDASCLPAVLNQNMWKIFCPQRVNRDYLIYGLRLINSTQLKITNSTHGHLAQGEYLSKLFPLAPEKEQHRIVAKVDQLMALCDQLKARLTQARRLNEQLATALVEQAVD